MPVGGHRSQRQPLNLEQHAVQVVADILLRHGKVGFLQETQQFLARYLHGLLRVDVIDHRKFRGG